MFAIPEAISYFRQALKVLNPHHSQALRPLRRTAPRAAAMRVLRPQRRTHARARSHAHALARTRARAAAAAVPTGSGGQGRAGGRAGGQAAKKQQLDGTDEASAAACPRGALLADWEHCLGTAYQKVQSARSASRVDWLRCRPLPYPMHATRKARAATFRLLAPGSRHRVRGVQQPPQC